MANQVVALSVDKVQTFLTQVIHSHVQEKQTEAATLKGIMNSSREISEDFFTSIRSYFPNAVGNELLSCSGVYIFQSALAGEEIADRLNQLFLEYYHNSQGQKLLRCVYFPFKDDKIGAIQEAKKRLKQSKYINAMIEKNREELFAFQEVKALPPPKGEKKKEENNARMFVSEIDALFQNREGDNENHFRIAVIKGDLDGMGDMFKKIKEYKVYRSISEILYEHVSLAGLHTAAETVKREQPWIFPFYVAGDDIFFAVAVENLIDGIRVCRNLLQTVNEKLIGVLSSEQKLTMSVGVEITWNRQPIRYYLEMVEGQLKHAKKSKWNKPNNKFSLEAYLYMKISIYGLTYFDVDYKEIRAYKAKIAEIADKANKANKGIKEKEGINHELQANPIWNFFLDDVRTLYRLRAEDREIGTSNFFYTLLERLMDESVQKNDMKYINSVLYSLLPKYMESPEEELKWGELRLNSRIIQQLCQWYDNQPRGYRITLSEASKHQLESYLRLLLLFSDKRFQIAQSMDSNSIEAKNVDDNQGIERMKEVRKFLFSKPVDYLYYEVLRPNDCKLSGIFANYIQNDEKDFKKGKCLQRLSIEKSMFFKLRKLGQEEIQKAAEMIALRNPTDKDRKIEVERLNTERREQGKAPYHLYFDKKEFIRLVEVEGPIKCAWSPDFVDSLMLLYAYYDMLIQIKSWIRENEEEQKDGKKHLNKNKNIV